MRIDLVRAVRLGVSSLMLHKLRSSLTTLGVLTLSYGFFLIGTLASRA